METRRMCPHCRAFITIYDKICPYCDTAVPPRFADRMREGLLNDLVPSAQAVTIAILTLNITVYLVTMFASMSAGNTGFLMGIDVGTLSRFGAARIDMVLAGQWWRLLTAGFLHGGLMHILFNSWALMDVGAHSEQIYGQKRMVAIYLLSTIGGFTASMWWNRGISVGASAGLFGLIGAMIAVGTMFKTSEAEMIKSFYLRWAIYGLLMGLLPFFRVDNAAHIGGLATGFVTALAAGLPANPRSLKERLWTGVAGLMVLIAAYSFVQLILWLMMLNRMGV